MNRAIRLWIGMAGIAFVVLLALAAIAWRNITRG